MSSSAPIVRRLAGVTYDPVVGRYRLPSGRFVARETVLDVLEGQVIATSDRMRALAESLQAGRSTIAEWQIAMADEVKSAHLLASALERGGFAQLNRADLGWIGAELRRQYEYLRNFALEIERGLQPMDGRFLVRVEMYGQAARATQREMARRIGRLAGATEERRVLGEADHCRTVEGVDGAEDVQGCVELAAKGWRPSGELPRIGATPCRVRCRCHFETRGGRAA